MHLLEMMTRTMEIDSRDPDDAGVATDAVVTAPLIKGQLREEVLSHDKRIRNLQSLNLPRKTRKDTSPKDCVSCAINPGISQGIVPAGTRSRRAAGIDLRACQVSVLISTLATWKCSASCHGTLHLTCN